MSSSVSDIETRPSSKMAPRTKNKKRTQSKSASQGEIEESGDFVGESCAGDIDESDPWEDIDMRDGREGLLFRRASKKRVLKRRDLTPKEREAKELKKLRFQEWLLQDILCRGLPRRKLSLIETLPLDVKYLIFDELWYDDDSCSSVCFGLACKMFYAIHRRRYMGKISLHVRTVIRTRDDAFLLRKSEDTGKEVVVVKKGPWLEWAGPSLAELLVLWMSPKYIYNPSTRTYQSPSRHEELAMLHGRQSHEPLVPENLGTFTIQPIILVLTPSRPPHPSNNPPPPPTQNQTTLPPPLIPNQSQSQNQNQDITTPRTTEIPIPFFNTNVAALASNFLSGDRFESGSHVVLMADEEFRKIINSTWEGMGRLRFTRACGWWISDLVWDGEGEAVVEFCGWVCPGMGAEVEEEEEGG